MNNKKQILILTADAGFGHRSAAIAVKAAIEELYSENCQVEIVNPLDDPRTPFFLRDSQTDYDTIIKRAPELYHIGYDISDSTVPSVIVDGALTVLLYEVIQDILLKHRPDAILTTFPLYQSPIQAVFTIRGIDIPLMTVITDLATVHRLWFSDYVDACLVPTEAVHSLALGYDMPPEKVHITGIPVHPNLSRERRSKAEIRASLKWEQDLPTFLVVASQRVERLQEKLNILNHFGHPLQLAIVAGNDLKLYKKMQQVEWHVPVHLYEFVDNMPELMHAADALICKAGGLVVTEALAAGLPMLLVDVIHGQETGNAEYVIQNGAGDLVKDPIRMLEQVSHWLRNDSALLNERAANALRFGKPEAAYTVARMLWEAIEHSTKQPQKRRTSRIPKLIDLLESNRVSWKETIFKMGKKRR
ncbi:MAG: glycosyltransferase [Anaerolineaceae bacterium]|nr:glycosyltransferase [Anaerolineaceae bacterium]